MARILGSQIALGALLVFTSVLNSEAKMEPGKKKLTCYNTLTTNKHTCETTLSCFAYIKPPKTYQYGCVHDATVRLFMCNALPSTSITAKCCDEDMCNKNLTSQLHLLESTEKPKTTQPVVKVIYVNGYGRTVIIAVCISAPVCLITITIMLFIYLRDRRLSTLHKNLTESDLEFGKECKVPETIQEFIDQTYSGSGSGLPLLIQRTIARQVILHDCIGKGRYGEVYRGKWRGEDVAVKIFSTRDECSWRRETEMYQTVMLRHEHILGFIAADNKDNGTWTQLWLVTDYHKNGSLCDYLTNVSELNIDSMLDMAISIASGLAHLHMEVHGTRGKPAIAHRDLKSRNILVKNDGKCCIADLGLAVYYNANSDSFDLPSGSRVGTKRYMAPEVLDNTEPKTFHEYKKIDIYAMGLVLWEIARRCAFPGNPSEEYQLPYFEKVQSDPSIEEMKDTVCIKKFRPSIPTTWTQNPVRYSLVTGGLVIVGLLLVLCTGAGVLTYFAGAGAGVYSPPIMKGVTKIMKECWYECSAARLPALRVKKTLISLKSNDPVDV